jgi:GntR family transcriptional regulator
MGVLHTLGPQVSLPERAADDLRMSIRDGRIVNNGRLPSELELVRQLRVSRSTLRHAISILEEEGLVRRRQGHGTFVVDQVRSLQNNVNQNFGVTDLIEAAGCQPGTRDVQIAIKPADLITAQRLAVPPRSRVHVIRRTRLADERPIAYTVDLIPAALLAERGLATEALGALLSEEQSLYRLLARFGLVVHHGLATIQPIGLDATIAKALELKPGALALLLDQVDYTADGEPVVLSREHHPKDVFTVQVYRKGPGPRW